MATEHKDVSRTLPSLSGSMAAQNRPPVRALARRYRALLHQRAPWEQAWQSLADHFLPTHCRLDNASQRQEGPRLNSRLVDATGVLAMRVLAAGLQGGLTSPARPWFRLSLDDSDLAASRNGQLWLDEVARRMRVIFQRSNFYNAVHTLYAELGTFGTAFMFELADPRWGFSFVPLCAGEYVLDCDARRRVDTVFRRTSLTLRQIVQSFGADVLPETLREAAQRTPEQEFNVIQAVYPRENCRPSALEATALPYASVHWLEGREGGHHLLRESGYASFPGFGPRWESCGNDVYGRSPAMDALPDCRMLQQMGLTTLKAIHKAVDPPMSVAAGLKSVGLDLTPGGINYVDSLPGQSPQAATPLLQIRPDTATARSAMEAVQNQIRNGLYNDLFKLVLEGRPQVTASEIAAREEEKLILVGPVLERLHHELFIPLIDRTFQLMCSMDMVPPSPPEFSGHCLKVEFISLLAQAQKLVGIGAADQYLALTLKASAAWPEALDSINVDHLLDSYATSLGLPVNITRSAEERAALRSSRAVAEEEAGQMQKISSAAELIKTLSQSPLAGAGTDGAQGTVLDGLLNVLRSGVEAQMSQNSPRNLLPATKGTADAAGTAETLAVPQQESQ